MHSLTTSLGLWRESLLSGRKTCSQRVTLAEIYSLHCCVMLDTGRRYLEPLFAHWLSSLNSPLTCPFTISSEIGECLIPPLLLISGEANWTGNIQFVWVVLRSIRWLAEPIEIGGISHNLIRRAIDSHTCLQDLHSVRHLGLLSATSKILYIKVSFYETRRGSCSKHLRICVEC